MLQDAHNKRLRAQLGAQELKAKNRSSQKLVGDGLPRLLTGSEFVDKVARHKARQDERAEEQNRNRKRRNDMESELADEVGEWEKEERERKITNEAVMSTNRTTGASQTKTNPASTCQHNPVARKVRVWSSWLSTPVRPGRLLISVDCDCLSG